MQASIEHVRAKWYFSEIDVRAGDQSLPLLGVSIHRGVTERSEGDEARRSPGDLRNYKVCEPADVVINRMRGFQGAVGIAPVAGVVSPEYMVLRTRSSLEPRFFAYLVKSTWFVGEMTRRLRGIGTPEQGNVRTPRVNVEAVGDIEIVLPPLDEQRAIADYLDRETARIDALIEKKLQMRESLGEWEQAKQLRVALDWRQVKSRTLRQYRTQVLTGPFGTILGASEYIEGGVPLINPTHIVRGRLVPEPTVSVPTKVAIRLSRYRLRPGDLVMGRKGDVGRAAIVPPEADGWICGSDSIAIRTHRELLRTEYLAAVLNLALYRQQLEAHSTGATIANVNESVLLRLQIPDLSLKEQDGAIQVARESSGLFQKGADWIQNQLRLLQEHRQALITAAATGQLGIPRAA